MAFLSARVMQRDQWRFFGLHSWRTVGRQEIRRHFYVELHHGVFIFWRLNHAYASPDFGEHRFFTYETSSAGDSQWSNMNTVLGRAGFDVEGPEGNGDEQKGLVTQWIVCLPAWFVVAIFAILPGLWFRQFLSRRRQARRATVGLCPACGYDLCFSPDRCPECGRPRDLVAPPLNVPCSNTGSERPRSE